MSKATTLTEQTQHVIVLAKLIETELLSKISDDYTVTELVLAFHVAACTLNAMAQDMRTKEQSNG